MVEKKINGCFPEGESESMSGRVERPRTETFESAVERVKKRIEFECFDERGKDIALEIARIMAKIELLPCEAMVRIAGQNVPVREVAMVYSLITNEHVLHVMENLLRVPYEIKHMITYIRTALYNSVFEMTLRTENRVTAAMAKEADW